jgi:hypothetical protein
MSTAVERLDDDAIRTVVTRLARRHRSGGEVIERAAILAEGAQSAAILTWITDHAWEPEELPAGPSADGGLGLHGTRLRETPRAPRRYVLAPGAES